MEFAICAEKKEDRRTLLDILGRRLSWLCADIDVAEFESVRGLFAELVPGRFSVLFLDADMEGMADLSAAKKLRALDADCQLIILADSAANALRSYSVHPVGYLVKPFDPEAISRTLDWCRHSWSAGLRPVSLTVNRAEVRLPVTEILYAEICGRSLSIRASRDSITVSMSMSEFQRRVGGAPFLRCPKSFLVNMYHISGVEEGGFLLDNGERVPLSTERKKQILAEYTEFTQAG